MRVGIMVPPSQGENKRNKERNWKKAPKLLKSSATEICLN